MKKRSSNSNRSAPACSALSTNLANAVNDANAGNRRPLHVNRHLNAVLQHLRAAQGGFQTTLQQFDAAYRSRHDLLKLAGPEIAMRVEKSEFFELEGVLVFTLSDHLGIPQFQRGREVLLTVGGKNGRSRHGRRGWSSPSPPTRYSATRTVAWPWRSRCWIPLILFTLVKAIENGASDAPAGPAGGGAAPPASDADPHGAKGDSPDSDETPTGSTPPETAPPGKEATDDADEIDSVVDDLTPPDVPLINVGGGQKGGDADVPSDEDDKNSTGSAVPDGPLGDPADLNDGADSDEVDTAGGADAPAKSAAEKAAPPADESSPGGGQETSSGPVTTEPGADGESTTVEGEHSKTDQVPAEVVTDANLTASGNEEVAAAQALVGRAEGACAGGRTRSFSSRRPRRNAQKLADAESSLLEAGKRAAAENPRRPCSREPSARTRSSPRTIKKCGDAAGREALEIRKEDARLRQVARILDGEEELSQENSEQIDPKYRTLAGPARGVEIAPSQEPDRSEPAE